MKKKFIFLFILILTLNVTFTFRFNLYDTISGATSSSTSSSDQSKTTNKKHKSNALKVILNDEQKKKNEKLTTQIDTCFKIIKVLNTLIKENKTDIDVIDIYVLVDDNNSIISGFDEKELKQINSQLKNINEIIPKINNFLELYDKSETNSQSFKALRKDIEILSSQYRIIQWKLYI